MPKPDSKVTPYKFVTDEAESTLFAFETDYELTYEVLFKNSGYIFVGYPDIEPNVFELIIRLVFNKTGRRTPPDTRIAATIADIVKTFMSRRERVIVYICDSSDLHQVARARKFDGWYNYYRGIDFIKINRNAGPPKHH